MADDEADEKKVADILRAVFKGMGAAEAKTEKGKETYATIEEKALSIVKGNERLFLEHVAAAQKTMEVKIEYLPNFKPSESRGSSDPKEALAIGRLSEAGRKAINAAENAEKKAAEKLGGALLSRLGRNSDLDSEEFIVSIFVIQIPGLYAAMEADKKVDEQDKKLEKEAAAAFSGLSQEEVDKIKEADKKIAEATSEREEAMKALKEKVEQRYKNFSPKDRYGIYEKLINKILPPKKEQQKREEKSEQQTNLGGGGEDSMRRALAQYADASQHSTGGTVAALPFPQPGRSSNRGAA